VFIRGWPGITGTDIREGHAWTRIGTNGKELKSEVGKAMNMDGQDIQDEEQGAAFRHLSCTSCSSMLEFPGFIRVHSCPFVDQNRNGKKILFFT